MGGGGGAGLEKDNIKGKTYTSRSFGESQVNEQECKQKDNLWVVEFSWMVGLSTNIFPKSYLKQRLASQDSPIKIGR